jgi:deazaflavin-dependent oxidoreductase (nitroreductase family)
MAEDWNARIIDEFRANGGKVGGAFAGRRLLLLHHRGAKTGIERTNPLAYRPVDGGFAVFASKGGAPTNPDWYYNLIANPDATIEVGTERIPVRARVAVDRERDEVWRQVVEEIPAFGDYEAKSGRRIPVVMLERR